MSRERITFTSHAQFFTRSFHFTEYGASFVTIARRRFTRGWFAGSRRLLSAAACTICAYSLAVSCSSSGDGISVRNAIALP